MKIRTLDYISKKINVQLHTSSNGEISLSFYQDGVLLDSFQFVVDGYVDVDVVLPKAEVWDVDSPKLIKMVTEFKGDQVVTRFGIRTIEISPTEGFLLNGKRVILQGGCIHHDNGILGAVNHPFSEKRKARILKEQGFNAVRSAHNPISKAFLEACDELGLLVVDEYSDMWYIHKTKYDYATHVDTWWKQDLLEMVQKDYNHPSVVMYSIGNEVAETSEDRGIKFTKEMTDYLHQLDHRYVTCGVNIFFNYLYSLGFGVYSDKKAKKSKSKKHQAVGSEFFNVLAGKFGDKTMKIGAWLPGSDRKTKKAFSKLDVAGYNYGIMRYKKDVIKYPSRVILGTETFCKDACSFIDLAKDRPAIIGDFVWSAMDYLGEVAIGAWVSENVTNDFTGGPGWISSGSGRIDLLGHPLSEMAYLRVAYDLDPIRIGVIPVNEYKVKHSPSAWKMSRAIESWSWGKHIGEKTVVEVYSKADRVRLDINEKTVGHSRRKKNGVHKFLVKYEPGILTATAFDANGYELGKTSLSSAKDDVVLSVVPEDDVITIGDLAYVNIQFTDQDKTVKPLENAQVHLTVEGGELIAFGHACPYNLEGYYLDHTFTYYGRAMAIIRPHQDGRMKVLAKSRYKEATATIKVIK